MRTKLGNDHPETLGSMNNLALLYTALGRHTDAFELHEETLALRKTKLGSDHPSTLTSISNLSVASVALNRHSEALTLIDEFLAKAKGPGVHPHAIESAIELRLRCCQKLEDVAGCRATAEIRAKLNPSDASTLYDTARFLAVTAAFQAQDKIPHGARLTQEDADKAVAWLYKAVAAGWKDVAHMKRDTDLDSLRHREDFKKLLADLDARFTPKEVAPSPRAVK